MSIPQQTGSSTSAGNKLSLSIGFIVISIGYALWIHTGGNPSLVGMPLPQPSSTSYKEASTALSQTLSQIAGSPPPSATVPVTVSPATIPASPVPTQTGTPMMQAPMMPKPKGLYADGSFVGSVADAYYGLVQVKAVISGGQLADVQFLQYPSDRSTSRYINSQAMPLLKQEAIQAQNAQVNGVSGATFTSEAFIQSLSSALALAKN
jgi:uncharacterized protein with FMN-binding domain